MDTDLQERRPADDLAGAARRATCNVVKARARLYRRRPSALEALYPGLSMVTSATLVAIAEHLVERERQSPRRWFGFGGEINLINAQAARLLGRAERRQELRERRFPAGGSSEIQVPLKEP